MIDFLGNYNLWYTGYGNNCRIICWWPGTCHESPLYACKLGIQAALNDMQNNHPNDFVSLIMFSMPQDQRQRHRAPSDSTASASALGQNYPALSDSLWYPPATVWARLDCDRHPV